MRVDEDTTRVKVSPVPDQSRVEDSDSSDDERRSTPSLEYAEESEAAGYPDGGTRAWMVVLGVWFALFPTFGTMNINGILQEWLAEHQLREYSTASISWIFSVWSFLFWLGGIQVGPIFDSYGLKYTLVPGCVGMVASTMALSVAEEYYQFMLGFSVLGGLSASAILTPSLGALTHWFFQRRAIATGIATTAGGIGGIALTALFGSLRDKVGFPWAIRVLGFLFIASFGASILLIRTRIPRNKSPSKVIDLRSLTEAQFTLASLAVSLAEVGMMIVITYIPSYGSSHDVTGPLSYQLMSIFSAASIFGRVIPNLVADRWGRFNVMIVTGTISTILIFALWLQAGNNLAAIVSFTAFYGFWSSPAIGLSPVCIAQISPTENYGKRYGTTTAIVSVCVLVAIPVAGEILKAQDVEEREYSGLIGFCGACYAVSTLCMVLARGVSVGWRLNKVF